MCQTPPMSHKHCVSRVTVPWDGAGWSPGLSRGYRWVLSQNVAAGVPGYRGMSRGRRGRELRDGAEPRAAPGDGAPGSSGRTFSPGLRLAELRSLQAAAPQDSGSSCVSNLSASSRGTRLSSAASSRLGRRCWGSKALRQTGQAARGRPAQCCRMQPRQKLWPQSVSRTGSAKSSRQQEQCKSRTLCSRSSSMTAAMAGPGAERSARRVSVSPGASSGAENATILPRSALCAAHGRRSQDAGRRCK